MSDKKESPREEKIWKPSDPEQISGPPTLPDENEPLPGGEPQPPREGERGLPGSPSVWTPEEDKGRKEPTPIPDR
jgi:hypothetical protein